MKTLVLDPGHGGADPGAVADGLNESNVVLELCKEAKHIIDSLGADDRLTAPVNVQLTRSTDTFISLGARAAFANARSPELFVSVHCNAFSSPTANGFEVFTTRGTTKSDRAATIFGENWEETFPWQRMRKDTSDGDLDKEANFAVLRHTHAPAILLEVGFITNPEERAKMRDSNWYAKASGVIAYSALQCMGIKVFPVADKPKEPEPPGKPEPSIDVATLRANVEEIRRALQRIEHTLEQR